MKIRLSVPEERYETVKEYLSSHGIEVGEDGEYTLTASSVYAPFLAARDDTKAHYQIKTDEVIYIEAFGKDIEIHTLQGTYYSLDRMYQLEAVLDPKDFIRVSKSVIISGKHVKKIRASLSMKFILTMSNGALVDVTRTYYSEFRRFFNI